jgi:hypothetical protein
MGNPIQLPVSVQDALNQQNADQFAPANNGPVMPGTNMPLPPNQAQTSAAQMPDDAPDIHPVDAMASAFISHLISKDKAAQPQNPTQRGSFADKLAAAVGNVGTSLGDASHATDNLRSGQGWLSGITNTMAARTQREREQSADQRAQDAAADRKKMDDVNIAVANANLRSHALNIQKQEKDIRDQSAASGSAFISHLRDGGFDVQGNISQDQLNSMVTKDPNYLATHTGRITGYEPVYDAEGKQQLDKDGSPVESPVWSIVNIAPGDVSKQFTVSPELSKKWADAGAGNIPAGTVMPATVANKLDLQAQRYGTTLAIFNKDRLTAMQSEVKEQLSSTLQDPEVQHAVAMAPTALDGLYAAQKNVNDHLSVAQQQLKAAQAKGDQQAASAAQDQIQKLQGIGQNLDKAVNLGFTDADRQKYAKEQDQARKDAEKERHERAQEDLQNRRADITAQKETQQKGLGDSYKTENKEFDTIRKPLETSLGAFSTLRSSLDQGTAAGDSVVAPALLKALVAGGGVRITQAEINQFTHGRSTVEDMKGILQKMSNGKSITPEQRQQVYALVGAVEAKTQTKKGILEDAQDALDGAATVADQRKAVSDSRRKLDQVDAGQYNPNQQNANAAPKQPKLPPAAAGTVNIQDSQGGFHNIPANQLGTARQRDPNLQVIQ